MAKEVKYYFGIPFEVRGSAVADTATAEPKFKVGDRVSVVKDGSAVGGSGHCAEVGDTYTLASWAYGRFWRTNGPDFYEHEIDLIPTPTFTAGDRVRLTRNVAGYAIGDSGVVEDVGDDRVGVAMDDRLVYRIFPADALELVAAESGPKFKAGDLVRCLKDCEPGRQFTAGHLYKVRSVPSEGWLSIAYDDKGGDANGWCAENFEPAAGVVGDTQRVNVAEFDARLSDLVGPRPCIVSRVLDGQPRPSNIPFIHASADAALDEAERLAKNNPGQEFAVYQRVGARVCETTYNMKEVA